MQHPQWARNRMTMMFPSTFNSELRLAPFLPRTVVSPRTVGLIRRLLKVIGRTPPRGGETVNVNADVSVRVFRPKSTHQPAPALLWIHGGGYLIGNAAMGDRLCRHVATHLGVMAVSVEYRLAPDYPFPTPLEDCYKALRWLAEQSEIDPSRIAIGGESAGGGLAASLALLAKERGAIRPVLQVLSYPMLDDRTTARQDLDESRLRMWNQNSNRLGWRSYLGAVADVDVSPLASPARYKDLSGLPPAWIGVGTNDLFYDENIAYTTRLRDAGVTCTLHQVPGAYHGFDLVERKTPIARAFLQSQMTALDAALTNEGPTST
ncbi:alpha/beta hydrolase [Rhodococcus sp. T2V]|uniref:alpha/beta hydrolase n=1 Tax=Rhodococcus sp. T2V TaxID=3034164 RepID=UPI0023E1B927|nr:alpha/beta hydrolase [Rhodococcus sp. T2V]MDF3313050.1 alpha/beta hydrolase [Rhodococcus sp. T2V]